eukprot:CAMPEP_0185189812 /NCGR_PEP_ID=MMETSP1140-20130426/6256_1 /TAXON_ID=298111 /ORGANISM="Pavlova sp., Strain CCMP459" /LENGTH=450 /DNA_ID=CAMNT_0027756399 /DNA_START=253 /DNA_END=1605 /DNA_ORIENTATION=-
MHNVRRVLTTASPCARSRLGGVYASSAPSLGAALQAELSSPHPRASLDRTWLHRRANGCSHGHGLVLSTTANPALTYSLHSRVRSVYSKPPVGGLHPSGAESGSTNHTQATPGATSQPTPPEPQSPSVPQRVTMRRLMAKYRASTPISVVTAYDYPSAQIAERAGVDVVLVGDSVGMVVLGYDSTTAVTMDEMVHHAKAARRGAGNAFMVVDLPFGSYTDVNGAMANGVRLLKEAGADAIKLEGGRRVLPQVRALVNAGMAVMGHVGLTPQTHAALGGYLIQGKTAATAIQILEDARALQDAGCFSVVLEMVPGDVAALITQQLSIPTIGIGAGVGTSGQVQVMHDLLGLYDKFHPKFAGRYAAVGAITESALSAYVNDVVHRRFPGGEHSFAIPPQELSAFRENLGLGSSDAGGCSVRDCESIDSDGASSDADRSGSSFSPLPVPVSST